MDNLCDCNIIHENKVKKVIKKLPNEGTFFLLSNLYKVIGDNTRTKILYVLSIDEMCVCDIANILNMTKSAISHQLKLLKECKLVISRKEGKEVFYSLSDDHILKLFNLAMEHIKEDKYER